MDGNGPNVGGVLIAPNVEASAGCSANTWYFVETVKGTKRQMERKAARPEEA
jgi:hypothetical protein